MQKYFLFFICGYTFTYLSVLGQTPANSINTISQDLSITIKKEKDTVPWNLKQGGVWLLGISQNAQSNWINSGGYALTTISSYVNYFYYYKEGRKTWDNNIDYTFAYANGTDQTVRGQKTKDILTVSSKYGYAIDTIGKLYWSVLGGLITQLFNGYDYTGTAPVLNSAPLAPAKFTLAFGVNDRESDKFSVFASPLAFRAVTALNDTLSRQGIGGVPKGSRISGQIGTYVSINYSNKFPSGTFYKTQLDLFSNYLNHPENIGIFFTNQLTFTIYKHWSLSFNVDFAYDDAVKSFGPNKDAPRLQVSSLISVAYQQPFRRKRLQFPSKTWTSY